MTEKRRCFQSGGGFAVWVDVEPEATEEVDAAVATEPEATEEVDQGDCDGCAKKPSVQIPPQVP